MSSGGDTKATNIDLIRDTLLFLLSMDLSVEGDDIFAHFGGF
jgi:hypothetical protein